MKLRRLEPGDVDAVLAIQLLCAEAARWSRGDYERVASGEFLGWVAEIEASLAGFLIARKVADEMEILNFAVAPVARRAGTGSRLLSEGLRWGKSAGAARVFLEVRASNDAALGFYEYHCFALTGRRVRYYTDPSEDALLLGRVLA